MKDGSDHKMSSREKLSVIVGQAQTGNLECCGLILSEIDGDVAHLTCNECGTIVCSVPKTEAWTTLSQMVVREISSATCSHCGGYNVFSGFSSVSTYRCQHCRKGSIVILPRQ